MNSKELLEHWNNQMINGNRLSREIEEIEEIIVKAEQGNVCFCNGNLTTYIRVLSPEKMNDLKNTVIAAISNVRDEKVREFEQLLGIYNIGNVAIDPNGEVIKTGDTQPVPDPVEVKLAEILKKEEEKIGNNPKKEEALPEQPKASKLRTMTKEEVERMYITENKTMKEIADYYGVKKGDVNNFIYLNHLSRKSFQTDDGYMDSKASKKERP